ncbi:relaxase domain-containing protein [Luteococcus sp. OSA5]|uniref:relaxase domain-containing protein n=1 Tax=Luteococcus sp. OSA5 TaxID=3401630 RepID=UPI003B42D74F
MSMQKLAAGTGYAYLTKQVARQDVAERGHVTLVSYYSERGEVPGVWVGSGMAAIDGLAAGDVVTPEHMRALFGAGLHPLAELPSPRFEGEQPTAEQIRGARMIGQPFRGASVTAFQREVADRLDAATRGRILDRADQAAMLAEIRTQVATEGFIAEHGRQPSELELSARLARELKAPAGVAGFDLTFSPVKSVSALWALADPSTAAIVERAHQAAIGDALRMIEQHALFTRVGKGGAYQDSLHVELRGSQRLARVPDLHPHDRRGGPGHR